MYTFATILSLAATIAVVSGQQYQQPGGNFVDEYSDYQSQRPGHAATPRSYASDAAPARQAAAAQEPKPTPVAILKQINRHNEDGSYTYGFEGADGSFKIETKLPTGEVKGKYGFVDDGGKVRVVEYGANQYGFQPAGEGITVAPPTLVDETTSKEALEAQAYQDYQEYQQQQQQQSARASPNRGGQVAAQRPQYQPAYQPPSHTQAVYAPAQVAPSHPVPKPPAFTPAVPQIAPPRQSALLQHSEEPVPPSQLFNQGPAQFSPAPVQEHRGQPQPRSQSGGLLDQLARDYALPQGVAPPLHDISFGYY